MDFYPLTTAPRRQLKPGEHWAVHMQADTSPLILYQVKQKARAIRVLKALRKHYPALTITLGTTTTPPGEHYQKIKTSPKTYTELHRPAETT